MAGPERVHGAGRWPVAGLICGRSATAGSYLKKDAALMLWRAMYQNHHKGVTFLFYGTFDGIF